MYVKPHSFYIPNEWNNKKPNKVLNMQKTTRLDVHKNNINAMVLDPEGRQ